MPVRRLLYVNTRSWSQPFYISLANHTAGVSTVITHPEFNLSGYNTYYTAGLEYIYIPKVIPIEMKVSTTLKFAGLINSEYKR